MLKKVLLLKLLKGYKFPKMEDANLRILINGKELQLFTDNMLEDWAEADPVSSGIEFTGNVSLAKLESDLPSESKLGIYVSARSSRTSLRVIYQVSEVESDRAEASVHFDSHCCGGTILIRIYLVVIDSGNTNSDLAPSNNDILADWYTSVHLEGDENRASVYFKQFEAGQSHTLWEIDLSRPSDDDEWMNRATNSVVAVAVNKEFYLRSWDKKYSPFFLRFDYLWAVLEIFIQEPDLVDFVFEKYVPASGSFIKYCHNLLFWLFGTDDLDIIKRNLKNTNWLRSQLQSKLASQVGI
jgi:hypothetical protein